jgi:bifunctional enzyme CysN/CysC
MQTSLQPRQDLLRFLVAGNVDDGKSTLVGRLLHDARGVYVDQLAYVRAASRQAGLYDLDFSLITDGLKAEREQGITIDVAYRYFSTARRKFIIADVPGHEQYTRNMATGASTADLALLLIDVSKGLGVQTYRHALIAYLLGIRNFAVVINKMDLVNFDQDVFGRLVEDFRRFASRLETGHWFFVPTCSLHGDNVVHKSSRTSWFDEPSLLEYLETTPVTATGNFERFRFPVQYVIRSSAGGRRYAGQISSGSVRPGQQVMIMPSGNTARVLSVSVGAGEVEEAFPSMSVTLSLDRDIDVGRGDMLVSPHGLPEVTRSIGAIILWMDDQPLQTGKPYLVKHTTRTICITVTALWYVLDPASLDRQPAETLRFNQFGEVEIEAHHPLYCDLYSQNRMTGAFIVMDPVSNATLAAGMIVDNDPSHNPINVIDAGRANGLVIWFTGLSSAGKSTIGQAVYEKLWAQGVKLEWLDGDVIREHLSRDLGFSKHDRDENIRRIAYVAKMLARNGIVVLVTAISPYRAVRDEVRRRVANFIEVYVHAPLSVCEQRDLKGIYRRVRNGEIRNVTGVDDPYEPPVNPEVECRTDRETLAESTHKVLEAFNAWCARKAEQAL